MRLRCPAVMLLSLCALPAAAQEDYPGQNNLAAGLACYRNLDYDCALSRLEQALAVFSPEKDPHYLDHLGEARLTLALIHVSRDNFERAEGEFRTLLLLIPDFELPPGDHPPKVRYLFDQAKESFQEDSSPPPVPVPAPAPAPAPEVPAWSLGLEGRFIALFGGDADKASSGPGAALSLGLSTNRWLILQLEFAYARHSAVEEDSTLQAMSLGMAGLVRIGLAFLELRLGGGVGVLAMGTRDRYDHWGFILQAVAAVAWPSGGWWSVTAGLHPSALICAGESSFFLPAGLALEARW